MHAVDLHREFAPADHRVEQDARDGAAEAFVQGPGDQRQVVGVAHVDLQPRAAAEAGGQGRCVAAGFGEQGVEVGEGLADLGEQFATCCEAWPTTLAVPESSSGMWLSGGGSMARAKLGDCGPYWRG